MSELTAINRSFLSMMEPTRAQRRLALGLVIVSVAIFAACAPFAKMQLAPVPAFIPVYEAALVVNDLITAILLFGQFSILRSRPLAVLAAGYLFTATITVAHALTFPGLFAPTGLLGAGPQSTAWIYMLWHAGFPLVVILFALRRDETGARANGPRTGAVVLGSIVAAIVAAAAAAALATAGQDALPNIMQGNTYTPVMIVVVSLTWGVSLLAVAALWTRRTWSVLDLWLAVAMCAWLFDIALSAVLNQGRFDLGFYAGRIYGLFAASFVLAALLLENGWLYAQLARALDGERREGRLAQQRSAELTLANKELEAFTYSVSHDLRAPLRAIDGFSRILMEEHADHLPEEDAKLLGAVRRNAQRMGRLIDDLLAFSRLGRQGLTVKPVELNPLVDEIIEELRPGWNGRVIDFRIGPLGTAEADPALLKQALINLISNAVKYSGKRDTPVVEIACIEPSTEDDPPIYFVKDNGAGFDMRFADKLFGVFQRLHGADFDGTGVGLAIVQRVVLRHGGRVWADAAVDRGATFYFTLQPEMGVPAVDPAPVAS
jgi:signal transduction histidine kinase